jgi:peroxiredoxin
LRTLVGVAFLSLVTAFLAHSQSSDVALSDQEKPIVRQLQGLRNLPDDVRAKTTRDLAVAIRKLPQSANKLGLAAGLANLSTEGDFGHDALQEVASTLSDALRENPPPVSVGKIAYEYTELAQLVRYEHVHATLDNAQFKEAMKQLQAEDDDRKRADFALSDLQGKSWSLGKLRGKVVLLNFWATWCPPCRKEMPDLDALYNRFKDQGLVVLAISDEDQNKVISYLAQHQVSYPILLDSGRKVNEQFHVDGIPQSFLYDRGGRMVAEAIDMRTRNQFLDMLAQAGLK